MNRNVLIGCLLATVMLLASCSKKNVYENVLPKDAAVVVSVDLVSMADKSGGCTVEQCLEKRGRRCR